ncbi:aspartic proteinase nepenthesin-1-like [Lycium barbarum]|uniref:aspartic proteinase nepenthesin-1-like n=1 Tax=Lycium barbarum TaxID=112863 RepID=UPI00293E5624|nr:aspartic proteinase nepenthesin-1-like [Lycium barbarum]
MSGGIMVDIGATLTYFTHDFYIIFRDTFRSEVRNVPLVENPVFPFDTCYTNPDDRMLFFPVVKLYFGSVNMRNKLALAQERVVVKIQDLYCLAFIGWRQDFSILGAHQLQGVGLTFDTSANTLSSDLDECD